MNHRFVAYLMPAGAEQQPPPAPQKVSRRLQQHDHHQRRLQHPPQEINNVALYQQLQPPLVPPLLSSGAGQQLPLGLHAASDGGSQGSGVGTRHTDVDQDWEELYGSTATATAAPDMQHGDQSLDSQAGAAEASGPMSSDKDWLELYGAAAHVAVPRREAGDAISSAQSGSHASCTSSDASDSEDSASSCPVSCPTSPHIFPPPAPLHIPSSGLQAQHCSKQLGMSHSLRCCWLVWRSATR